MDWIEVAVVVDGEAAEAVAEALRPLAYQSGVVLEQLGDPHTTDPTALEPEVTVKIYWPAAEDTPQRRERIREILYYLSRLYPVPQPTFRSLEDADWANAWKEHYHPFRIGRRVWICPSWVTMEELEDEEQLILTLDPGMAFGTGLHPTTQMCLQSIEDLIRPGFHVLDVGSGSGILSIAAARLGATRVVGVDTDEQAVKAATANALANGVAGPVTIRQGSLSDLVIGGWDLVVVNILAPVIIGMLREEALLDYVAKDGHLILSGIIEEQLVEIEGALATAGAEIVDRRTVRDWVCLIARRGPD